MSYGRWGRQIPAFEAWKEFSGRTLALLEANPSGFVNEFGEEVTEADTKADFPEFLNTPIRRQILAGFNSIVSDYRRYAGVENMPDFRPRTQVGLNPLQGYAWVGDTGGYVDMRRSERVGAQLAIDTYGATYGISRQAIINDETGQLLARVPDEMGREAARFIVRALVSLIESNPNFVDSVAFFHSSRGNTGTAALSEDALVDAMSAMTTQLDPIGNPISVDISSLIVQSWRQELVARRIVNSTATGSTVNWTGGAGAGSQVFDKGTDNVVSGILPGSAITRDPFFTDVNDWYLFADPARTPAFSIGFLNGQERPFVGLKDPEVRSAMGPGMDPYTFDFDTIRYKSRSDFGVALTDPRYAYRAVVA